MLVKSALGLFCLLLLFFIGSGCGKSPQTVLPSESSPVQDLDATASAAFGKRDYNLAQTLVKNELLVQPDSFELLELAGDIESARGDVTQAVQYYEDALNVSRVPSQSLCDKLGRTYMACGRPFSASEILSRAVELHPKSQTLRADLAGLLGLLGRERDASPHLQWLVMHGHGTVSELRMLIDLNRPQVDPKLSEFAIEHQPQDSRPRFSIARRAAFLRDWELASTNLKEVVKSHPEFNLASALYLRTLVEQGDEAGIDHWRQAIPPGVDKEPQFWIATGIWAERNQRLKEAVHAYWQAAVIDHDNGEALVLLAAGLAKLGMVEESQLIASRAGQLARARDLVDALLARGDNSQSTVVDIATTLEPLGRLWEAAAWLRLGARMTNDKVSTLPEVYARIHRQLTSATPWQLASGDVARQLPLNDWPKYNWQQNEVLTPSIAEGNQRSAIRFEDVAEQKGLKHTCKIQHPANDEGGLWIYQAGAGGAAVIDYDLDGWPDLYLTTIDGTPKSDDSGANELYRNLEGSFSQVTLPSDAGDKGFTQGVSAADINADGFDDLFVANLGKNRIYLNQGDGTFDEVSADVGLSGNDWTSSVSVVDFDSDGLADLFEVGYCAGKEVLEIPCIKNGKTYACLPKSFPAQKDRVWQGQADGRFIEKTEQWLASQEVAHGFGIVVGFFDDQSGLDVYVANDMSANHFWSATKDDKGRFFFRDQASARGLAVDRRSLSQASMGIAAGDPDLDGDIDFYVTHFTKEYNTFYEQVSAGLWVDMSSQNGHEAATLPMLAFGTQFLDADNNGTLELWVANGHLNDYRDRGEDYRMPNQLFERSKSGMWSDLPASQIGDYFTTKRLSRSLVTLDFDRDGRLDSLVTHLFDPVSLLANRSESKFKSVTLYLKSTSSHPDAIGARATLSLDGKTVSAQLIGGGGYQCSNQRCLHMGTGGSQEAKDLRITWPSGAEEHFGDVEVGGEYLLVEGAGEPFKFLP